MAKKTVLGLYADAAYAAEATESLQKAGVSAEDYDVLTDTPYPEGAFAERTTGTNFTSFPS